MTTNTQTTEAQPVNEREQKALEIAARTKLTRKGDVWIVPSQSGPKTYKVNPDPESPRCTCPDFEFRQQRWKHIFAVEIVLQREVTVSNDGTRTVTETVTVKKKYAQDWANYNKAQTTEKSHFLAFLYELCSKIEEPIRKRKRGGQRLPLADVLFSVTFKVYSGMSARRFASDMRDALAKGYVSKMPSFNSIFDYMQMESLTPYLKYLIAESASPLKSIEQSFAVDSSGFSTTRFVRWFDVKYGNNEDWHDWIKMHITCGTSTHIVTSVELSNARMHDSPYFKPLIEQTAKAGFTMKEIVADKGYISGDNLQTAVDHGATPYIPFKTNVTGKRGSELWKKLFTITASSVRSS
jgi:hypothetical protein